MSAADQIDMIRTTLAMVDAAEDYAATLTAAYFAEDVRVTWELGRITANNLPGQTPEKVDADLARSLLAGWIAGAMAGIVATGLVLVVMARKPGLAARIAGTRRLGIIGVILANGLTLTFTLIGLVLAAEAHHHVGAERDVGDGGAQAIDEDEDFAPGVAAAHGREDPIGA